MTHQLKDLLEDAAEHVSGPDLAAVAWGGARTARRRRRLLGAAATAAAAAVVVAAMVRPDGREGVDTLPASTPTSARPLPSATGPEPWRSAPVDLLGVAAVYGPTASEAASLPRVDAETARTLGLPERLEPRPGEALPWRGDQPALLPGGDVRAPVTAVVLRRVTSGAVVPILYRPALRRPWVEVDTLRLAPVTDVGGNASDPMRDRAISPDGTRVAFAQPGKVILLDVPTKGVRTLDVEDPFLEDVAWTDDGSALIARSSGRQWRVDPTGGGVSLFGDPAYAGLHEVVVSGDENRLRAQRSAGLMDGGRLLPGLFAGLWGETVSGPGNRVAVGGNLSLATEGRAPTLGGTVPYQGILTVTADTLSDPAVLLAPSQPDAGLGKGCCRALRWLDDGRLLLAWDSDLLVWDPEARTFERASRRPTAPDTEAPGTLTGSYAVAP